MTAHDRGVASAYEGMGRQVAVALRGHASAVVVAENPDRAAQVALGIADAESTHRRVVLCDLVGDLAPFEEIVRGDDPLGVYDSFTFGTSLFRLEREASGIEQVAIITGGTESPAIRAILASPKWEQIVRRFDERDELFLAVADPDADGFSEIARKVSGVVLVGMSQLTSAEDARVLAKIPHPQPVIAPTKEKSRQPARWRRRGVSIAIAAAALALSALVMWRARNPRPRAPAARQDTAARVTPDTTPQRPALLPANAADSTQAAAYSVQIVAANTSEAANFELRRHAAQMPAATISTVPVGDSAETWYYVYAGAFTDSAEASRLLRRLRRRQVLADSGGTVVRTPLAFRIDSIPSQGGVMARAREMVASYQTRGVPAYALMQRDGSARVYAGAFDRPEQASLAESALRVAGATPVLEYRTGRIP